jgi:hypothetical protein
LVDDVSPRSTRDAQTDATIEAGVACTDCDAGEDAPAAELDAKGGDELSADLDARVDEAGCAGDACTAPRPSIAVLFGGIDFSNNTYGDTWEWDGQTWRARALDAGPPARRAHAMAALNGKIVLFGGRSDSRFFADTWEYDGTQWTERTPASGPNPEARDFHAMATLGGKVVLYGGHFIDDHRDGGSDAAILGGSESAFEDTWEWDGVAWTKRQDASAPNPFLRLESTMSSLNGVAMLFGGFDIIGNTLGDTWTWDGTAWTSLSPTLQPHVRMAHATATLESTIVLFGGFDGVRTVLADTWTWNGATWLQRADAGPSARAGHSMTTRGGRLVLFGGGDQTHSFADTWEWDGSAWVERASSSAPPARQFAAMATR